MDPIKQAGNNRKNEYCYFQIKKQEGYKTPSLEKTLDKFGEETKQKCWLTLEKRTLCT